MRDRKHVGAATLAARTGATMEVTRRKGQHPALWGWRSRIVWLRPRKGADVEDSCGCSLADRQEGRQAEHRGIDLGALKQDHGALVAQDA